jgi:hypothetical protein
VLLATNITEKVVKIAIFSQIGILIPLYVEKSTIIESKTKTTVKTIMKINEVRLSNDILVQLLILSFTAFERDGQGNNLYH